MKKKILGIELGSTRIKAMLIDENAAVLADGSYEWENELVEGHWSYSLDRVREGTQAAFAALAASYRAAFGEELVHLDALGVSAMMHGYLAFDGDGNLLVPFRTWRDTTTGQAAGALSSAFGFNVPMRWSVAHYYQALIDGEAHAKNVAYLTTLAGFVHEQLTGKRVLGVGDASGMFPITNGRYDRGMLDKMNALLRERGVYTPFEALLPTPLSAGQNAGALTDEGAAWLDPTGRLQAGCICCAPEGDAGTGMVATNSVTPKTANVSAGTSAFLMAVLEKPLSGCYEEIDIVTTPHGAPVAMVHANNFTSEMTAWANLFEEVLALGGASMERGALFEGLYRASLTADPACGGLLGYNFLSGEPVVGVESGAPLMARLPNGRLTLANFMKMQIYSALGALATGCEILKKEGVRIDRVCGHGGFFKTPFVGQSAMSAAVGAPVTVMENAGEGGAWGMAVLALFAVRGHGDLEAFLTEIFSEARECTVRADRAECEAFSAFLKRYQKGLSLEKIAVEVL